MTQPTPEAENRLTREQIRPGATLIDNKDTHFRVDRVEEDTVYCVLEGHPTDKRQFDMSKLTNGQWKLGKKAA